LKPKEKKIAEERKKLEQEQKELEEAMEILKKQQEIDMRRRKIEEEKVIIRRAYLAEQRITHPEEAPKERTPLPPMKGFLDDMTNIDHDNDWSDFFSRYNDAEEELHKPDPVPQPKTEPVQEEIQESITEPGVSKTKNDVELRELNLPQQRPNYPRESSKHKKKAKGEVSKCCIIM